jgi:hypothetical protein
MEDALVVGGALITLLNNANRIPDVPFVEADHDPSFGAKLRGDTVANSSYFLDEPVHRFGTVSRAARQRDCPHHG